MKKISNIVKTAGIVMCSAMLLTACGNTSDSSTTKQTNATKQEQVEKKDQGDLNKVKTTKTLEITPTKVADVVSPEENKKR